MFVFGTNRQHMSSGLFNEYFRSSGKWRRYQERGGWNEREIIDEEEHDKKNVCGLSELNGEFFYFYAT